MVRTQVDVVLTGGAAVLNADDADVAGLADYCDGEVLLFGLDPEGEALRAHRARKGRAVLARDASIVLATGTQESPLINLSAPVFSPITNEPPEDVRPQVLAAVAAAWSLGVSPDLIRGALLRFGEAHHNLVVH